jgi:hypothetical protein
MRSDGIVIAGSEATRRSRATAPAPHPLDCFALLAMTIVVRVHRIMLYAI